MNPEDKEEVQLIQFTQAVLRDPEKLRRATEQRQVLSKKRAEARRAAEGEKPAAPAKVVRLPAWPDEVRGVPNGILRSALFGVIRRGRRRALERESLETLEGVKIRYTGWQLDQADLDVWEHAVHLARRTPLGERVRIEPYRFLREIGRATGGKNREWQEGSIVRLKACAVEITIGRYTYCGSLIDHFWRDEATGEYYLELNPKLLALWDGGWTAVDWETRRALQNQPLAQWLHGFYASHADAYPLKVETLRRLCGSDATRLYHFRAELRAALSTMQAAGGIQGWEIGKDDLVRVDRCPSPTQVRHLIRKAVKPRKPRKPKT